MDNMESSSLRRLIKGGCLPKDKPSILSTALLNNLFANYL